MNTSTHRLKTQTKKNTKDWGIYEKLSEVEHYDERVHD